MNSTENLWGRIILFSLFFLMVNFWSLHHLGAKATHFLIANGPLALVTIANFLAPLFSKKETQKFKKKARRWFFFFIKTPILIFLYGFFFIAGSFVSSVTVMSSGVPDEISINLSIEGQSEHHRQINDFDNVPPEKKAQEKRSKNLIGPNGIVRFIKFTYPFGRPYFLEAKGYLRHSFDLYPWIGKKIRVTKDLSISPSILIRVPAELQALLAKGKIEVTFNNEVIAEEFTNARQGSILVGPYKDIPNSFVDRWKTELIVVEEDSPKAAAISLLAWLHPIKTPSKVTIFPGMTLEAKYLTLEEQKITAWAKFQVSPVKIQDILLETKEQ